MFQSLELHLRAHHPYALCGRPCLCSTRVSGCVCVYICGALNFLLLVPLTQADSRSALTRFEPLATCQMFSRFVPAVPRATSRVLATAPRRGAKMAVKRTLVGICIGLCLLHGCCARNVCLGPRTAASTHTHTQPHYSAISKYGLQPSKPPCYIARQPVFVCLLVACTETVPLYTPLTHTTSHLTARWLQCRGRDEDRQGLRCWQL